MDQAIILAAGEGQRLRPLTSSRPKVMLAIGNKPVLQYVVEAVAANGIRRIVLVVGFHKEQVQDYFGSGESLGVDIKYVEQRQQLGTAHALKQAASLADDYFLVISGDNIVSPSTIAPLLAEKPPAILVKPREDVSKYGVVIVEHGLVSAVVEKPPKADGNLVNTGIYSFSRSVFSFIDGDVDLPSVLTRMVSAGEKITSCETNELWLDIVYPWDMLKLNATVLEHTTPRTGGQVEHGAVLKGSVSVGDGSIVRSGSYLVGPVVVGKNCEIGPHACIFPSTSVGDDVVLSPFSSVRNSIIERNVQIGMSSHLEDTVVATGSRLGSHLMAHSEETVVHSDGETHLVNMGAVIGEHSSLGHNVVIRPGTMIGNRCRVQSLRDLHTNLPDGSLVM
ncbi:MAG: NTP transferase domain-containing protein [Chloroflexi bacterium]|nr:NTP transferase domain-containing protein [Chloroflexota bacterium]